MTLNAMHPVNLFRNDETTIKLVKVVLYTSAINV